MRASLLIWPSAWQSCWRNSTASSDPEASTDGLGVTGGGRERPLAPGARIGIFGGTFDPVHVGHLVAAAWPREAFELERVLLVVANEPWQKTGTRAVTPAEDRFLMVEAAVDGVDGVEACRIEIDRGGPSYTADTVRDLLVSTPTAE